MNKKIFEKQYNGFESSFDIERDVYEAINENEEIPKEFLGTIKITIEYIDNEN